MLQPGSGGSMRVSQEVCLLCACSGAAPCAALARYVTRLGPANVMHQVLPAGAQITVGDGLRDSVLVVKEGWIKRWLTQESGRGIVFGFYGPSTLMQIASSAEPTTIGALTDAILCLFPHKRIREIATIDVDLADWLHSAVSASVLRMQTQVKLMMEPRAWKRLLMFLHMVALDCGCSDDPVTIELPMSRQDIGDYLNMSGETVSRSFSHLHEAGVIQIRGIRSVVLNSRHAA